MQAIRTALGQYIYEAEDVEAEVARLNAEIERLRAHVLELESHIVDLYNAQEARSVLPGRLGHTDWCSHASGQCDCGAAQSADDVDPALLELRIRQSQKAMNANAKAAGFQHLPYPDAEGSADS